MLRTLLLSLLALAGCAPDPAASYLGGVGDPFRGAALNAPAQFGDLSATRGDPAAGARAIVQIEFLADAFRNDPARGRQTDPIAQMRLDLARDAARRTLGIASFVSPDAVMVALREAARQIDAGSTARAEAALSRPGFDAGGAGTLQRLGSLPRLPEASIAAGAAAAEIRRQDGGVRGG
ncbi:hypothetical protein C8P66_115135 [Humitalea rosea]|uniref:Uncharacterized protein n=1 Tax=Humitalea rosea TaxID=990373 RepID=A0A2W7K7X3_9PROT|nr:hypothetical protein [Humitalea rosea]PZW43670.1 hypothetical protein C8P66_115135 [Humitalea rosea]